MTFCSLFWIPVLFMSLMTTLHLISFSMTPSTPCIETTSPSGSLILSYFPRGKINGKWKVSDRDRTRYSRVATSDLILFIKATYIASHFHFNYILWIKKKLDLQKSVWDVDFYFYALILSTKNLILRKKLFPSIIIFYEILMYSGYFVIKFSGHITSRFLYSEYSSFEYMITY